MRIPALICLVFCSAISCFAQSQQPLCPRHIETPTYPPIARGAHVSGKVILKITIDADGKVSDAEVTNTGVNLLRQGAIDNVRQWTFEKPPVAPYTETLTFDYELVPQLGMPSKATFDLPDHVTIVAGPEQARY